MTTPVVVAECAGWLHEAPGGRAVLLLGAHGFEALCSARFLRRLGDDLAAAGLPVLRLDLPGTGDSLGDDLEPARWAAWLAAGQAGIAALTARGAAEIVVVGFRLGAMLAPALAAAEPAVTALALLAPPLSGRAYAREQMALGRLLAAGAGAPGETLCVAGFDTTAETLATLKGLVWQAPPATVARALVMPAGGVQAGAALADTLRQAGTAVETAGFEGYSAMMCDPTASRLPEAAVSAVTGWAAALPALPRRSSAAPALPRILDGPGWREERVRFGPGEALAGVVCRPARLVPGPAVVLLNAGAIPHGGWAGAGVAQARALAAAGRTSLRLDLPGMGDSRPIGPRDEPQLYRIAEAEIGAALDRLRREGHRRFVLAGACSGAFQAFHAAQKEAGVEGLVLVNQLCFLWSQHKAVELALWTRSKAAVMEASRSADAEQSGVAGMARARLIGIARRLVKGGLRLAERIGTAVIGSEGVRVVEALAGLAGRGVRILVVTSEDDPSLIEARRLFGTGGIMAAGIPGLAQVMLPDADHVLTQAPARQALAEALVGMAGELALQPAPAAADARRGHRPLVLEPI